MRWPIRFIMLKALPGNSAACHLTIRLCDDWFDVIRTIKLFLFSWPGFVVVVHRRAPAARVARIRAQRSGRRGGTYGLPQHFLCRFWCLFYFLRRVCDWISQSDEKLLDSGGYS